MVVVALIFLVLMQRSEGGALGMGGGSNSMMTGRGAADALARSTGILGAIFFITSLSLTLMAGGQKAPTSVVDQPAGSVFNLSFDPLVRWFEDLNKGAPSQQPAQIAPAPLAAAPPSPAEPTPTTTEAVPASGDVAPAPTSVLTRAAPMAEPSATPAPPAASSLAANRPAAALVAPKPAAPAPTEIVSARPPASVSASNNAAIGAGPAAAKPAESTEPQAPAARPRGRSGPDE
jgi:preprotein translocase subunit SecG